MLPKIKSYKRCLSKQTRSRKRYIRKGYRREDSKIKNVDAFEIIASMVKTNRDFIFEYFVLLDGSISAFSNECKKIA